MRDNMYNFFVGGLAGITSRTITSPFERLKMLRQIHPHIYSSKNIPNSLIYIYKNEGPKALFKGNFTNSLRVFPQTAIQFSAFNFFNELFKTRFEKKTNYFLSGGMAGVISYTAIYPLETVRSKISVQESNGIYKGIGDCLKQSIDKNGVRSLYRGCGLSAIGMMPFQGTNFLTYNYLKDKYNKENNKFLSLLFGSWSGVAGVSVSYPFDTIKRRLQLSGEQGNPCYKGIFDCMKYIYRTQGIIGFYRGLLPCYTKIFPANGIYFLVLELFSKSKN